MPFDVVAAFLRLGSKYFIEGLRLDALNRLNYEYPINFQPMGRNSTLLLKCYQGISFDVINLARQNNILSILPAAFYDCFDATGTYMEPCAHIRGFTQPKRVHLYPVA